MDTKRIGQLTRRVDRSRRLARVLGERRVGRIRGRDEASGTLDLGVVPERASARVFNGPLAAKARKPKDEHFGSGDRGGALHSQGNGTGLSLPCDELLPCLVAFEDDLDGVLLALGFTGEGKNVLQNVSEVLPTSDDDKDREMAARPTSGFPSGIL